MTLALTLYRQFMRGFNGFAPGVLRRRIKEGKEDATRWRERLGESPVLRPQGPLVWFHGVSVGESLSALPVIERLRHDRPDLTVLITTATTTSAEILAQRLPEGVIHQFAPVDTPQAVTAFLDRWRPGLAVFIESDIWPVMLGELTRRRTPHALISARITEKTFRGWRRFRASMRVLLTNYAVIIAQDAASETRLRAMGGDVAARLGPRANLKTLGAPLPVDAAARKTLRIMIGRRFVYLAASTHTGEEVLIAEALDAGLLGGDLLILAPRHPMRAADIRRTIEAMGLKVAQRSKGERISDRTQVYLADTLGELGLLFGVADITIMGGSFAEGIGGHNPLEAARLDRSVITGPDTANWRGIYEDLIREDAARRVGTAGELASLLRHWRQHPDIVRAMDARALAFSQREGGALEVVMTALEPLLPTSQLSAKAG
ncbi:3-deoxy-D-manno-octulosonic acid transferase [Asticcacaulis sp. EMRT-3]|uniref:3-deoxy-D-manno-octulosonic acid transferase n=1 Tax=Asticcacaulis sp. EMRT-3 TaxID=3040349 RepID=UPI0024AF1BF4|nr:3-deoxy-D-manno-octulosonic acid transferase [Asticcacaulis sp. EMRT-3]MDI7774086.1 3-deoxy-D-manno-octulosonic acid transferase [Asticcacaulis sp. EMRT-3]